MNLLRTPLIAAIIIVLLRMAIGWQFFYEGIWKLQTLQTPTPWTAAGYLKNAQGPLRGTFRSMTGDPDELLWLDVSQMEKKWSDWQQRFERHYQLDKKQSRRLADLVSGPKAFYSDAGALTTIPEEVDLSQVGVIKYDPAEGRLVVDGRKHLSPREYDKLLKMLPDNSSDRPEIAVFRVQLEKVYLRSSRLSYVERMKGWLEGNPEVAGMTTKEGEPEQMGEIEKYRQLLAGYESALATADQEFEFQHLERLWSDIQSQRSLLVGPIKSLNASLQEDARGLLTVAQLRRGAVPEPWTSLQISDALTMIGLTCLGLCLITGLLTRFSAVMAAVMLMMFYFAAPPFPWLPDPPGNEHSVFVNKNLIEAIALLAIAAMPTGQWFGIDAVGGRLLARFRRRKHANESTKPRTEVATSAT